MSLTDSGPGHNGTRHTHTAHARTLAHGPHTLVTWVRRRNTSCARMRSGYARCAGSLSHNVGGCKRGAHRMLTLAQCPTYRSAACCCAGPPPHSCQSRSTLRPATMVPARHTGSRCCTSLHFTRASMAALRLASVALVNSSIVPRLRSSSAGNDVDEQLQRVGGQRGDDSWPAAPGTRTPAAVMWDTGFQEWRTGFMRRLTKSNMNSGIPQSLPRTAGH